MEKLSAKGEYMTALAELPLHVGFRLGELLSRRGQHFDLDRKTVEFDETKTGLPGRSR